MNKKQLDNKVSKDVEKLREDVNILMQDKVTQLGKLEDRVYHVAGKTKEDLTSWVDDGVSQVNLGLEKVISSTREFVGDTAGMLKKEVGSGLNQYNTKAQQIADKVPGNIGKQATKYSWVTITIALVSGLLLGLIFKPGKRALT